MIREEQLRVLLERREAFLGFLAARLGGDHTEAEDLLQQGFSKVLATASGPRDDERLVPWFYRLLRNTLIDRARSRQSSAAREHDWAADQLSAPETTRQLCTCIEPLLATLPPTQAALLQRCELGQAPVAVVAASLGMTPNAASVTLHRARTALREKLRAFCGDCASGACLDCDCEV